MTKLHDRIRLALTQSSERWYAGLAEPLAEHSWQSLARHGIDRSNYGSARALTLDPNAPRRGSLMRDGGFDRDVPLELYDARMLARYGTIGLREPKPTFDPTHFEGSMRSALGWIGAAPAAAQAARALVWSVTPVDVEGAEFDTGYSDPALPFSIFIGAHQARDQVPAIRLAEGVLHEVMHLQLSLIEDLVPLIGSHHEHRHSPWQKRDRPTQGVVHGLYVFRVVEDWLRMIIRDLRIDTRTRSHCVGRLSQIASECAELRDLATSQDLTPDGRLLVASLLQ